MLSSARTIVEERIEPAIMDVKYSRRMVLDTLNIVNDFKEEIITLKVGKTTSVFYNSDLKTADSLEYRHSEFFFARYRDNDMFKRIAGLPKDVIYKNYPSGKVRILDRFDFSNWVIDEDWEKPIWLVTDSTTKIMGYDCILAKTHYRGRFWNAWFAPEIPVDDGPWKLCGLPGLILSANDSKGHYEYDAVSIQTEGVGFVEYYDYDAGNRLVSNDRRKSLSLKHKYIHTDIRYKILSSGTYGVNDPNVIEQKTLPHTNYDFEETDYPHN